VLAAGSLRLTGAPPVALPSLTAPGTEFKIQLFGTIAFNDVVLRMMATFDAEAGLTTFGERAMARFFKGRVNVRSVSGQKDTTLRRMANEYGIAGLERSSDFARVLISNGVAIP
jgi:hypothetical protein